MTFKPVEPSKSPAQEGQKGCELLIWWNSLSMTKTFLAASSLDKVSRTEFTASPKTERFAATSFEEPRYSYLRELGLMLFKISPATLGCQPRFSKYLRADLTGITSWAWLLPSTSGSP